MEDGQGMGKMIPASFKERYGDLIDDEFFACLERPLPKSFRVNTLKCNDVEKRFKSYDIKIKQVPWYRDGFISENPEIGGTLEHFLGAIYVQELVSMLPPIVVRKELEHANVLDACAAPGSKTTQLAALMENKGVIIANDIAYGRIRALRFNLEKTGTLNTVITNYDLRHFPSMQFDVILLDAPCSAEGTARKNPKFFSLWSPRQILGHAKLQKQLITKAFDLLAPGGCLVYSTCTFAPEENEGVVDWLLGKRPAALERIDIPQLRLSPGILEWDGRRFNPEVSKAARIWPHHNDTGGFFMAKVRK
jgi:NOL1/NOP2/sun family putative RNA methylase